MGSEKDDLDRAEPAAQHDERVLSAWTAKAGTVWVEKSTCRRLTVYRAFFWKPEVPAPEHLRTAVFGVVDLMDSTGCICARVPEDVDRFVPAEDGEVGDG